MSWLIRLRVAFYTSVIVIHTTNTFYMLWLMKNTESTDYYVQYYTELKFRFLTTWTVALQLLHSFLGLMCDVLQLNNSSKKNYQPPQVINNCRESVFAAIMWPCTFLVFTVFWTIYIYDRSLVFPESLETIVPPLSNHVMHTIIVPVALFEMMFRPRIEPKTHGWNVALLSLFLATYLAVFIVTYKESGIWLYPIFTKLYGTIYFYVLKAFVVMLAFFFYYVQWPLTKMINESKKKQSRKDSEVEERRKINELNDYFFIFILWCL